MCVCVCVCVCVCMYHTYGSWAPGALLLQLSGQFRTAPFISPAWHRHAPTAKPPCTSSPGARPGHKTQARPQRARVDVLYIRIYIYIYTYYTNCIHTHTHTNAHTHTHTHTHTRMNLCISEYYIFIYIYFYISINQSISIHTWRMPGRHAVMLYSSVCRSLVVLSFLLRVPMHRLPHTKKKTQKSVYRCTCRIHLVIYSV